MTPLPHRIAAFVGMLLVTVISASIVVPTTAQDKKKDPAKGKKDKKGKKDDKKIDQKKEEPKVDLTKEKRDAPVLELKGHKSWINSLVYAADGKKLLSASRDRTVKIWDAVTGKEVTTFKDNPENVKAALFISADKVAGSTGKWNKQKKAWEGEIRIWDKSGKQVKSLKGHTDTIECLAISRDGKFLASGSEDHTIKIWDLAAGKEIRTIRAHAGTVHGVVFSPDGKRLASAGEDKAVRVWDLTGKETPLKQEIKKEEPKKELPKKEEPKKGKGKKGKGKKGKGKDAPKKVNQVKEKLDTPYFQIAGPGRAFTCVAFSKDGKALAAGNLEGVVMVWDVNTPKEIAELKSKAGEGVLSVAFSPDGTKIATGGWDYAIRIFDAKSGKQLNLILAHKGTVTALAFAPDGKLASGGLDDLIKIWDLAKIQRTEK